MTRPFLLALGLALAIGLGIGTLLGVRQAVQEVPQRDEVALQEALRGAEYEEIMALLKGPGRPAAARDGPISASPRPTLEAVRRAWGIEGRLVCDVRQP